MHACLFCWSKAYISSSWIWWVPQAIKAGYCRKELRLNSIVVELKDCYGLFMQHCHSRIVPDLSFSLWITRCILSSKKFAQTFRKWREASPLAGKIVLSCEKYLARRYFTSPLMRSVFFLRRKGKGGGGLNRWTVILSVISPSLLPDSSPFRGLEPKEKLFHL